MLENGPFLWWEIRNKREREREISKLLHALIAEVVNDILVRDNLHNGTIMSSLFLRGDNCCTLSSLFLRGDHCCTLSSLFLRGDNCCTLKSLFLRGDNCCTLKS